MKCSTWRDVCGGVWRFSGRHSRPWRLHVTGGLAVVELDAVQGGKARLGLVTAVAHLELEAVSVEVDLTSPPLLLTLRGVVSQIPDILDVTVRLLGEDLDGLYTSQGLKIYFIMRGCGVWFLHRC